MFLRLRRFVRRFFNRSRRVNHEPINKVSLIVIILVDLFILFNVFMGLDDISRWPISPAQAYPCHSEWQSYRENTSESKAYDAVSRTFNDQGMPLQAFYASAGDQHRGQVSEVCLQYGSASDAIASQPNQAIAQRINDTQAEINSFAAKNSSIRQQYDSTLLEEIAGQPRDQSINTVEAAQARREIEQNNAAIAQRQQTLTTLKAELVNAPASQTFLTLLADDGQFEQVDRGQRRAAFWYPSIQLLFQGLFLLPLIFIASAVHRFAQRRDYGYVALISWHLLVIFCIPLIWKIFEFLQVGFLFELLAQLVEVLFGSLRFLLNYLQILLIPLFGFGLIKFLQRFVFNTRLQAANRIQNMQCVRCAKKLRTSDLHCPHCSYPQYHDCTNCHNLTYQHLPYCHHCGTNQALDL
ncbi:zinc ribbon domain-containing protein [soil metagenome]